MLDDYEISGWDTDMCMYKSIDDMWRTELGEENISGVKRPAKGQWYTNAREYWKVKMLLDIFNQFRVYRKITVESWVDCST